MNYDYLVFIGRFEPFHNGHLAVIERALKLAEHVIVLIGSAGKPRTTRNPWTSREREVMIRSALADLSNRLIIEPLRDHLYSDTLWISEVQRRVAELTRGTAPDVSIGLIGHHKDRSSSYLEQFPQWPLVQVPNVAGTSATDLRDLFFAGSADSGSDLLLQAAVPAPVFAMLSSFRSAPQYDRLLREYRFIKEYRASWAAAPYPPTFVTVDAVVVHSGHVLLVQRAAEPGKDLWAFPGGFVDAGETLQAAVIRELREETALSLSDVMLNNALRAREVFDHPDRSLRGRTITHAFHFDFPFGEPPAVHAGDDARQARWVPLSEALEMEEQFHDDHFHILEHFIGRT